MLVRIVFLATLLSALPARAVPLSFDLFYSDLAGVNTATAILTIDDAVVPNPGVLSGPSASAGVLDFTITVSGPNANEGTFTLGDFNGFGWAIFSPVDFSVALVGQAGFFDFAIFGIPPAPVNVLPKTICSGGCTAPDPSDAIMSLRSFAPRMTTIAEPVPMLLVLVGLVVIWGRAKLTHGTPGSSRV